MDVLIFIFFFIGLGGIGLFAHFLLHKTSHNAKRNYSSLMLVSLLLLAFCSIALVLFLIRVKAMLEMAFEQDENYSVIGPFGDFVGGIMNPVIAFIGIIAASLAFYVQYRANQQVQEQFNIQKFESQFYEMLRLHKDNVAEVSISEAKTITRGFGKSQFNFITTSGRKAFEAFDAELKALYDIVNDVYKNKALNFSVLNKAYHIFFFGLKSSQNGLVLHYFDSSIADIQGCSKIKNYDDLVYERVIDKINNSRTEIFQGTSTYLAHLYRHLYHMVKYVAEQDESFLTYEDKRKYLRILRAQLSNPEQALLFYNWKSGFGDQWENHKNKYFTDYRMIHNLYADLLHEDFDLEKIFDLEGSFRRERNRANDPLFEFEDWKRKM